MPCSLRYEQWDSAGLTWTGLAYLRRPDLGDSVCTDAGRTERGFHAASLRAVEQVGGEESRARMASAWERRNCDRAGPVCRRPGSMPLALRIFRTADAATFMPSPASSPWTLRYPQPGFSRASRRVQCPGVAPGRRPALLPAGRAARRRRTLSRCPRTIVSGVIRD